jgi:hypothetical protein
MSAVIAGAAGALTACGSDGIPIEELGSELEHRICARAAACSGAESVATCESTVYFAESTTLLTLVEAVKARASAWTRSAPTARTWSNHQPAPGPSAGPSRPAAPA